MEWRAQSRRETLASCMDMNEMTHTSQSGVQIMTTKT